MELTSRPGLFDKTVNNWAAGAVNWHLKRRMWGLTRTRRRRRQRGPHLINPRRPHPVYRRRFRPPGHKKVVNPEKALDFVGTVLKTSQKYPILSTIWHECRWMVVSVLENKDYMAVQERPKEFASYLFDVIGIIDNNIEIRKALQPIRTRSLGTRHRSRNAGRYIEQRNEAKDNGMTMYNFLVGDD